MKKDQEKLQIYHNRYMRSAIVGVCKIIAWTIAYSIAIGLICAIATIATYDTVKSDSSMGMSVAGFLIFVCTLVYIAIIISEVLGKINEHKTITAMENEYMGMKTAVVNTEKREENGSENAEDADEDDIADDLI